MPKFKKENRDTTYVLNLIQPGEIFVEVTTNMVDNIYDYYQVSNFGRVYHNYLKIIMKPGLSTSGYHFFILSTSKGTKIVQLHRLVMIAFNDICNREYYQVNHKNGDKLCNYLWNLEWVTAKENMKHAYDTGINKNIGENHPYAKIDNKTADIICKLILEGLENKEIAEIIGTAVNVVQRIRAGNGYKNISKQYIFNRRPGRLFTDEEIHCICHYFETHPKGNLTIKEHCRNALIYNDFNDNEKNVDTIRKVYTRKYCKDISNDYWF